MPASLKSISLFSGIGGLDEGLHRAGFEPLFCCERDEYARASLRNWVALREQGPIIENDVIAVEPHALMARLGMKPGGLDLLAGGPPCQAFSLIGKRRSLSDPRGSLLFEMIRFAEAIRPRAILIEQVKGLRSAADASGKRGGVLAQLLGDLEDLGYQTQTQILKASDFGVAQHRERLFIVGVRMGMSFDFPIPTHVAPESLGSMDPPEEGRLRHVVVRDVLSDLPPPVQKGEDAIIPNHVDVTPDRDRERIHGVPEGAFLAAQFQLPASQRMRLNPKKDTTKFRRLSWDRPSLTLRGGEAFYHPTENRYITPREAMRIHGCSDSWELEGPIRGRSGSVRTLDQHRQVANAVPPALAAALGQSLRLTLRAVDPQGETDPRPPVSRC